MSITYSFSDNITYGTDDINNITKRLCGAGIAPFPTKDTYNVSDLNSLTSAVVGQGVALEGCRCTAETIDGENIISVAQGIVYFQNGAALEVDEDGYSLTVPISTPGYVYAYFSTGLQTADILFGEVLPTDGYAVPLAQILTDNSLRDCRSFARSKVATFGKNVMLAAKMERVDEPYEHNGRYVVQKLPEVDLSKFNYAVLVTTNTFGGDEYKYFPEAGYHGVFFDIAQGKKTLGYTYNSEDVSWVKHDWFYRRYMGNGYGWFYVEIISGELCLVCEYESTKDLGESRTFNCTVCLM